MADLRSEGAQQQQDKQEGAGSANASWHTQDTEPWEAPQQQNLEEDADNVNASGSTQATQPWCPPWSQYLDNRSSHYTDYLQTLHHPQPHNKIQQMCLSTHPKRQRLMRRQ